MLWCVEQQGRRCRCSPLLSERQSRWGRDDDVSHEVLLDEEVVQEWMLLLEGDQSRLVLLPDVRDEQLEQLDEDRV